MKGSRRVIPHTLRTQKKILAGSVFEKAAPSAPAEDFSEMRIFSQLRAPDQEMAGRRTKNPNCADLLS